MVFLCIFHGFPMVFPKVFRVLGPRSAGPAQAEERRRWLQDIAAELRRARARCLRSLVPWEKPWEHDGKITHEYVLLCMWLIMVNNG